FQDAVRVALEEVAVFVDAGLALLGVNEEKFLLGGCVAGGFPLRADREIRATPTAQARVGDHLPHGIAAERLRPFERAVAANFVRIDPTDIAQQPRLAASPPPALGTLPRLATVAADRGSLPAVARAANGFAAGVGRIGHRAAA